MENNENRPAIEGERGISSVSGAKNTKQADTKKKMVMAAMLCFLGFVAYANWPRDVKEEEPDDYRQPRRVTTTEFGAADIPVPKSPAPEIPAVEDAPPALQGPIGRIRVEEEEEPSRAELIYKSSIQAPLIAYSGSSGPKPATAGSAQGSGGALLGGGNEGVTGLESRLRATRLEGSMAAVLKHPELTVTQGTLIPCVLETAMDSTQPGLVVCRVSDDVYGTTGTVIVVERGSKVVGQYRGGLRRGESRIFVIWSRIETPNGVIVTLDSPASDQLGRAGFGGDIDTKFWTRFAGTIMFTVIDSVLSNQVSSDTTDTENINQLAAKELDSVIDIPIIMRKNQGEEVAILVARDLDFSSVYRLTTR